MSCRFLLSLIASTTLATALYADVPPPPPPMLPPNAPNALGPNVPPFHVRKGYRVTIAADNLQEARFMEFDDRGTLYLAQPDHGNILAFSNPDETGRYQNHVNFVTGHKSVHGMHFFDGWLWFTESGAVYKTRPMNNNQPANQIITVIPRGDLPSGGHWWRSILVTPTGFYTSIGDPSNATDVDNGQTLDIVKNTNTAAEGTGLSPTTIPAALNPDHLEDREKIWFYALDGKKRTLFCSGIRNTEKLRFRPGTTEVWGFDHGSDNFGGYLKENRNLQPVTDLNPTDELNHYVEGGFYGHPFIVGNHLVRREYENRPDILQLAQKTIPPEWSTGPHWANNGWCFITKNYFPNLKGDIFVACHGSWNSTVLQGYCIDHVFFDPETGHPYGAQKVIDTRTPDLKSDTCRPVDCVESPDGTILFTGDTHPTIFRISKLPQ